MATPGFVLRTRTGKEVQIPDEVSFIEFHTEDKTIAFVIAIKNDGSFLVLDKNTPEGNHYVSVLKLKFSETKVLKLPC